MQDRYTCSGTCEMTYNTYAIVCHICGTVCRIIGHTCGIGYHISSYICHVGGFELV